MSLSYQDGISQKSQCLRRGQQAAVADFGGRVHAPLAGHRRWNGERNDGAEIRTDSIIGTNVFVLFDTSNYMYRGMVCASDAIADFVRGLDRADSFAVYTFSRNLSRVAPLNHDRGQAIFGLRKVVAGERGAL